MGIVGVIRYWESGRACGAGNGRRVEVKEELRARRVLEVKILVPHRKRPPAKIWHLPLREHPLQESTQPWEVQFLVPRRK